MKWTDVWTEMFTFLTLEIELIIIIAFIVFFTFRFYELKREIHIARKYLENDFKELLLTSYKSFETLVEMKTNPIDKKINEMNRQLKNLRNPTSNLKS